MKRLLILILLLCVIFSISGCSMYDPDDVDTFEIYLDSFLDSVEDGVDSRVSGKEIRSVDDALTVLNLYVDDPGSVSKREALLAIEYLSSYYDSLRHEHSELIDLYESAYGPIR